MSRAAIKQRPEPTQHFLRLLAAVISSGRAHIANPKGGEPTESPQSWGWEHFTRGAGKFEENDWRPRGKKIGWVDGDDLYLEAEAAFAEVQRLAGEQGESLAVSAQTLRKRLNERGLLVATEQKRGTLTVRHTLEGRRREVLHLHTAHIGAQNLTNPTNLTTDPKSPGENGHSGGRVPVTTDQNLTTKPDQSSDELGHF